MTCLHCPRRLPGRIKVCWRCKSKNKRTTVSVNAKTYALIRDAAKRMGVTMGRLVEEACRD